MAILLNQTVSLPAGLYNSPSLAMPLGDHNVELSCSRDNWPVSGVDLTVQVSFDGSTYNNLSPIHIATWVDDGTGRHPLSNAVIGFGWAAQPTHVKARVTSPSAFSSVVKLTSS